MCTSFAPPKIASVYGALAGSVGAGSILGDTAVVSSKANPSTGTEQSPANILPAPATPPHTHTFRIIGTPLGLSPSPLPPPLPPPPPPSKNKTKRGINESTKPTTQRINEIIKILEPMNQRINESVQLEHSRSQKEVRPRTSTFALLRKVFLEDSCRVPSASTDPVPATPLLRRRHLRQLLHPRAHIVLSAMVRLSGRWLGV